MTTDRSEIIEFIEQGVIPPGKINEALESLGIRPEGSRWRAFTDRLLLWTGGLAMVFSILFFVAYNWKDMGMMFKFAMVEGFIILSIVAYCKWYDHAVAGKVSLFVSTIALGVLLALYGQTYQTGADPWQLFFNWAILILPWAIIGRFSVIWILWIILINISIMSYYLTFLSLFGVVFGYKTELFWVLFLFNSLALATWQLLAMKLTWLEERWSVRLLAVGSGASVTWLLMIAIIDPFDGGGFVGCAWGLWLGTMYFVYRRLKQDLFMLAGCCFSGLTVLVTFLGTHMLEYGDEGGFLLLSIIVIALGGGAALWLKHIHREFQS